MIYFNLKIEGDQKISSMIKTAQLSAENLQKPLKEVSDYMNVEILKNFDDQGATFGKKWKALRPSTIKSKLRKFGHSTPLVGTGKLRNNLKNKIGKTSTEFFNPTEYFKFHQSNKPRTSGLPRRVILDLRVEQWRKVMKIFHKYINFHKNG